MTRRNGSNPKIPWQRRSAVKWKAVKLTKGEKLHGFKLYRAHVKGHEYELAITGRLAILNRILSRSRLSVRQKLIGRMVFDEPIKIKDVRKKAVIWADSLLLDELEILGAAFGRPKKAKNNGWKRVKPKGRSVGGVEVYVLGPYKLYVVRYPGMNRVTLYKRGVSAGQHLGGGLIARDELPVAMDGKWYPLTPFGWAERHIDDLELLGLLGTDNPRKNPTYDQEKAIGLQILQTLAAKGALPSRFTPASKVTKLFADHIGKPDRHAAAVLNTLLDLPEFASAPAPKPKKKARRPTAKRPPTRAMKLLPERSDLEGVVDFLYEVFESRLNSRIYSADVEIDRLDGLRELTLRAAEEGNEEQVKAGINAITAMYLPFLRGYVTINEKKVYLDLPPAYIHPKDIGKVQAIRKWLHDFSGVRRFREKAAFELGRIYGPVWRPLPKELKDARIQEVLITWQSGLTDSLSEEEAFEDFEAKARSHAQHIARTYLASDRESAGKMAREDIEHAKERAKELAEAQTERRREGEAITTVLRRLESGPPAEQQWALLFRMHMGQEVKGVVKQPSRTLGRKKRGGRREPRTSLAYQDLTGEKYVLRRGRESMKGNVILVSDAEPKYHGVGAGGTACPTCAQIGRFVRVPGINVQQVVDAVLAEMAALHAG